MGYMKMKTCKKCLIEKEISEFYYRSNRYRNACKACEKAYSKIQCKEYNKNNKDSISDKKKKYYIENKKEILEIRKIHYEENKHLIDREKCKLNQKNYRIRNKKKISERIKQRKNNDYLYKLTESIRTLIWISITKNNFKKNSKTNQILGCDFFLF